MFICRDCKLPTEVITCRCTRCGGVMEVFRSGRDASFAIGCWMVLVFMAYLGVVRTDWHDHGWQGWRDTARHHLAETLPGIFPPADAWIYGSQPDLGGATPITQAYVASRNHFTFDDGSSISARLLVRNHPRFGRDVIVSISAGIIGCDADKGCHVNVSFDKTASQAVYAHLPRDKTPNILFLGEYDDMIARINEARVIQVGLPSPAGDVRHFSFDIGGLALH